MSSILYGIKDVVIDDMINEQVTYKLWENAGRKIIEAQLTADQINQLFANIEQGATAAGGNRTMIGKGKDAASAVNKAWEELKTKIQNSGPIKNVDAMYDQAAEKLKQATGGDEGVNKYVQKYRAFAKKYPVAQSFIYAALISAAGISGAGLGGAAALGLLKMADKLLQGEKFSSAAYSGAKTGAMAYGASKLGDYIKGKMGSDTTTTTTSGSREVEFDATAMNQNDALVRSAVTSDGKPVWVNTGGGSGYFDEKAAIQYAKEKGFSSFDQAMAANRASQAYARESINLSEVQVALLFEGIFDKIKGAASNAVAKGVSKVQQVGKNITTKVTADKLMSAWKKAGSPTDSEQIVAILTQNGVDKGVIDSVFKQMNIPIGAPAQPQAQVTPKPQAQKPAAKPAAQAAQPAATPQPTAAPAAKPAAQAAQPAATPQPTAAQPAAQQPAQAAPAAKSGKPVTKKPSVANNQTAGVRQQGGAFAYNPLAEGDFEVNVPGYGTMPLEMLKRHVKALANDFNDMVQSEEFIKAAYRTEQFYNALMALAKAMKAKSKDLDETHSTGTTVGSAGIGGGAGLGIEKSPIEKVIEKPLGESLPTSPGGMGQSYRKFTPKSAGVSEEQAPMFTPEEKIVNMNDKKSDGWRVYKAKPAGTKESSIMKGLQNEVNKHGSSKGK